MCGIVGILDHGSGDLKSVIEPMVQSLHHRGPDASGIWFDQQRGLALGHARLSILDLSPNGHQPMLSADGRYVVTYNGERYNFAELRHDLEQTGYRFRGDSDTEVRLAAMSHWGVEPAVSRCNGMFAFALWDRTTRTLYLVRDRLGEKPLYYGRSGKAFFFASELKALKAYPSFGADISRNVVALFMRHMYIPSPYSIYQGIFKLPPGTILTLDFRDTARTARP